METITLKTPGISCAHCEAAISTAVKKLDGASAVAVDLTAKQVIITYDAGRLTPDRIKTTIEELGYDVL